MIAQTQISRLDDALVSLLPKSLQSELGIRGGEHFGKSGNECLAERQNVYFDGVALRFGCQSANNASYASRIRLEFIFAATKTYWAATRFLSVRFRIIPPTQNLWQTFDVVDFFGVDLAREYHLISFSVIGVKHNTDCLARGHFGVSLVVVTDHHSLIVGELRQYLRGWIGYFGLAATKGIFASLDEWIRRRVRMCFWKKWRYTRTRIRKLEQLDLLLVERARAWLLEEEG